jgi:hypothetical protein
MNKMSDGCIVQSIVEIENENEIDLMGVEQHGF